MKPIGKYEVVEKIGEGGFGTIFKGFDPHIRRFVAVKTCDSAEQEVRNRFFHEAQIAGSLQHRHIVTIYDFGVQDGVPYLVQEYLSGEDLDRKIRRKDTISLAEKLLYLIQVARGLEYAHSKGVVHRDIKPANVRILEDGTAKIMDFGIAKLTNEDTGLTQTGMTLGTAAYLAPEQIRGETIGPATDIFSWGVMAWELLSFQRPFTGQHISTVLYAILNEPPPPLHKVAPDVPAEIEAVIDHCLEKKLERRYLSCTDLLRNIDRAIQSRRASKQGGLASLADHVQAETRETRSFAPSPIDGTRTEQIVGVDDLTLDRTGFSPRRTSHSISSTHSTRSPVENPSREDLTGEIQEALGGSAAATYTDRARELPEDLEASERSLPVVADSLALPDRYIRLDLLGRSARGILYQAWDSLEQRQVALKLFASDMRADEQEYRRFIRSGREWSQIAHENIVRVYEWSPGAEGRTAFFAFEYLEGAALDAIIRRAQRLSAIERYSFAVQMARGVACLHRNGVLHRDLRPQNIFVTRHGRVKILESGLAKGRESKTVVTVMRPIQATSPYSAPEEPLRDANYLSDLYSLGVTLLELFLGSFDASRRVPADRPALAKRAEGGPQLRALLARAVATEPRARFQTAEDLVSALVKSGIEDLGPTVIDSLAPHGGRAPSRGVVFMLHGIRTAARWQRAFSEVASARGWSCRTDRWNFGYFSVLKLLLPPARHAKIEWCRKAYQEEIADREVELADGELPSVVAHSFGTYILGYALLHYPYLRFDRVLLCGSILPVDFPWGQLLDRGQVKRVRNEYGTRDLWTRLARLGVLDAGSAGIDGFSTDRLEVEQERFSFSHSEYFDKAHMRARWITFLEKPA